MSLKQLLCKHGDNTSSSFDGTQNWIKHVNNVNKHKRNIFRSHECEFGYLTDRNYNSAVQKTWIWREDVSVMLWKIWRNCSGGLYSGRERCDYNLKTVCMWQRTYTTGAFNGRVHCFKAQNTPTQNNDNKTCSMKARKIKIRTDINLFVSYLMAREIKSVLTFLLAI